MISTQNYELTVIGDAFIDICIPLNGIYTGGVFPRDVETRIGGIATTAIWASRYGIKTAFIGKVGDDCFGKIYKDKLVQERVKPFLSVSPIKPTGICASLIHSNKDRTMIVNRGVNDGICKEDIPTHIMERTKYFYFSGYSFVTKELQSIFRELIREVKKYDSIVVFNGGAFNIIEKNLNIFKEIIKKHVDILILNEIEAKKLTNKNDIHEAINIAKDWIDFIIITLGKKGSIAFDGKEIIRTKIETINNVVDTTGAGDAFAGGFLAGLIKKLSFKDAIIKGHNAASKTIQKIGAI